MKFLRRLFSGASEPLSHSERGINLLGAFTEAVEYLEKCEAFTATEFQELDQILPKKGVHRYGVDKRQAMLSKYKAVPEANEKLRVQLHEELSRDLETVLVLVNTRSSNWPNL